MDDPAGDERARILGGDLDRSSDEPEEAGNEYGIAAADLVGQWASDCLTHAELAHDITSLTIRLQHARIQSLSGTQHRGFVVWISE